jgi:hypothetical protein
MSESNDEDARRLKKVWTVVLWLVVLILVLAPFPWW